MIENHRFVGAQWVPTMHAGGVIDPKLIVLHSPAGRITKGNVVQYAKRNDRKVAYHFVIERDATIVQMALCNQRCNHAGRSEWKGRKWCNGFSIGIALVDPGSLTGTIAKAKAWFGQVFTPADGELVAMDSPHHPKGKIWLRYTPEQLAALDVLVHDLRKAYPGIEIAGHYHVSPGRRHDPSPLLDIAAIGIPDLPEDPDETLPPFALPLPEMSQAPSSVVLARTSTEYKATNGLKAGFGVTAGGGVLIEAASQSNIVATKSYLDIISGFVTSYGVPMLVGACVVGWLVCEYIQHRKRESYDSGRYEPSGEADA